METGHSDGIFQIPAGTLDLPSGEIQVSETLGREFFLWKICDEAPIGSGGKRYPDSPERHGIDIIGTIIHIIERDIPAHEAEAAVRWDLDTSESYPERPDGGRWIALGTRYDMDFNWENDPFSKYAWGGERFAVLENFFSSRSVELHVYDTQPDLNRYQHGPVEIHDDNLCKLLYILYKGIPFEYTGFPLRYLEDIPHLVSCGVLRYEKRDPKTAYPAIPVLSRAQFTELSGISVPCMTKLGDLIAEPLRAIFPDLKLKIPPHLEEKIAEFRKYVYYAFPMAIVKKAIAEGDFLIDGPQKAIPMVLIIEEPENVTN